VEIERIVPRSAAYMYDQSEQLWAYIMEDPGRWFFIVASVILLSLAVYQLYALDKMTRRLRNGKRVRRGNMSSELLEREKVADAICEALEKLYYNNEISLRARNRWYARIGKAYKLGDLKPKRRRCPKSYCVWLKDKIARRISVSKIGDLLHIKPLPIPAPPGEPNGVVPVQPKGVLLGKRKAA
jgi:hypothetical protein